MAIPSVPRTKEVTGDLFVFSLSSPDIPLIWQVFWSGHFISFLTCHRSYYCILGVIRNMISPVTLFPECAIPSTFTEFAQFNMGFAVPSWGWSQPVEPFEWLIVRTPIKQNAVLNPLSLFLLILVELLFFLTFFPRFCQLFVNIEAQSMGLGLNKV